jgi:tripartite-type tricarboxylate transporter receptor subunit TctC
MKIKIFRRKYSQGTGYFGPAVGIFALLLSVSLMILALPANSATRDWPTKPITLVVPWPAGASTDLTARTMAPKLSKILGVPVQAVNKPGGSGIIGTLEVLKSPPDGYTLFQDCNGTSSIQYAWSENLPYKVEERTYIARAISAPQGLLVPASTPWKTVEDLVNAIRTNPAGMIFSNIGGTGNSDVTTAQFRAALAARGVDISKTRMVSFKGTGEVLPAVAGGHVKMCFATPSGSDPLISAGKLRALAITSRFKGWPNVPTLAEVGFPSVDNEYWAGLSGPLGLPANIVNILDNAMKEAVKDPDVIAKFDKLGMVIAYLSGNAYRKFVLDQGITIKDLKLK